MAFYSNGILQHDLKSEGKGLDNQSIYCSGPILMNAMTTAALAGVDVRVMMPAQKDHFLVFWGGRGNIEQLLRAGVKFYQYKKGFIHAKTILADDDISSVGTCNMDVRSLEINFEDQLLYL